MQGALLSLVVQAWGADGPRTERLEGLRSNQPLLDVALRLDSRFQALSPQLQLEQQQSGQQPLQLPEVDLLSLQGESLPLLNTPAACGLQDGDGMYCYRYGEACRQFRLHASPCTAPRMDSSASTSTSNAATSTKSHKQRPPQYVGLYLSDWQCSYQRRMLLHHDLTIPFDVLLRPYCMMRGIDLDDASFVWLQFYRKVETGRRGTSP